MRRISSMLLMCLLFLLPGCSMARSIQDVDHPVLLDPAAGAIAFKVSSVIDARRFEQAPSEPYVPSLKDGNVDDVTVTQRAYGRKRTSYGAASGDYLLPEGTSVTQLAVESLQAALARAGGTLVREGDPRHAAALPIELTVVQFWSWMRPNSFGPYIEFDGERRVQASISGFEQGKHVLVHKRSRGELQLDRSVKQAVTSGIDALTTQLTRALVPALSMRASAPSARN